MPLNSIGEAQGRPKVEAFRAVPCRHIRAGMAYFQDLSLVRTQEILVNMITMIGLFRDQVLTHRK